MSSIGRQLESELRKHARAAAVGPLQEADVLLRFPPPKLSQIMVA